MSETTSADAASIANHTLAYLRRIDKRLEQMNEQLGRQSLRIERIERDIREIRGDIITTEKSILNRMNEIYDISRRLEDHIERTEIGGLPLSDEQSGPIT